MTKKVEVGVIKVPGPCGLETFQPRVKEVLIEAPAEPPAPQEPGTSPAELVGRLYHRSRNPIILKFRG